MGIPENQLDTWSAQGAVTTSKSTYETIKTALNDASAKYAGKDYDIFLQGSYGNDTNIYADSDVDVVVRLDSIFYHDITGLDVAEVSRFNEAFSGASYELKDFKADVLAQLQKKFGAAVKPGNKAIFIKGEGARRDADVLVAAKFRRYYNFTNSLDQRYTEGICFFSGDGTRVANYPKQHSQNCTTKHQITSSKFKPAVRIFKNMRNRMIDDGLIEEGLAPSYFIEGLLYNAPTDKFSYMHNATVPNILNWALQCDRKELVCANEQFYLLRNGSKVTWTEGDCLKFLNAACKRWNEW